MAKRIKVKMVVSISGRPEPEFGAPFDKEWNFQPDQVVTIDARKAAAYQAGGLCVVLTAEEAREAESAMLNPATMETPEEPFRHVVERMRLRLPAE